MTESLLTGDTEVAQEAQEVESNDTEVVEETQVEEGTKDGAGTAEESSTTEGDKESAEPTEGTYEFKAPEGVELDQELIAQSTEVFKELKLSNEQAQKLVDLQVEHTQKLAEESNKAFTSTMEKWVAEVKADPEIGGDKFEQSVKLANTALTNLDPEGKLTAVLQDSGLGNHPELVRLLSKVGASFKEDQPTQKGMVANKSTDLLSRLYGND